MISQILRVCFWMCLVHPLYLSVYAETPEECQSNTPAYNETLCRQTCEQEQHADSSYCTSLTQTVPTTEKRMSTAIAADIAKNQTETTESATTEPQKQEVKETVLSAITSSPLEGILPEITTPKMEMDDVMSSAVSVYSSLVGSVLAPCVLHLLVRNI